jgi:hypothetical protein
MSAATCHVITHVDSTRQPPAWQTTSDPWRTASYEKWAHIDDKNQLS